MQTMETISSPYPRPVRGGGLCCQLYSGDVNDLEACTLLKSMEMSNKSYLLDS